MLTVFACYYSLSADTKKICTSNPTGLVIPRSNMLALAQLCQKKGITVISDEIYGLVTFDSENHYSALEFNLPNVVVTTGLSKHLSCGGWRVGLVIVPTVGRTERIGGGGGLGVDFPH